MPFPPFAPSVYFEDEDLSSLLADFSERLRRDPRVRPAMDRLIGNQWLKAEEAAEDFLSAILFLERRPNVDPDFLERVAKTLKNTDVEALSEIMLECALTAFPLQTAAALLEVTEMLAKAIREVTSNESLARRDALDRLHSRLQAGALMSRF